jgi:MFS family permease
MTFAFDRDVRNVAILAVCQALFMMGQNIMIISASLVGYDLATNKALATLPVTAMIAGTVVSTVPASMLMRRIGRRAGFVLGGLLGACGAAIAAYGIHIAEFWVFVGGIAVIGAYNAVAHYFRFAAADVAPASFKAHAISLVLSGGVVAGLIGPEIAKATKDLFLPDVFMGCFVAIAGLQIGVSLLSSFVQIPNLTAEELKDKGRPMIEIMRQPTFFVAVVGGMVGYGAMNMLMTATPLAMRDCALPFDDSAFVIQWHVIGMFAPSFFTGALIKRFGVLEIMLAGAALLLAGIGFALAGNATWNFWTALFLIGVGWNFTFIGGTTLLTECYTPSERNKTQAANDFLVFGTMAIASFLSGVMLHNFGWTQVNLAAVPVIVFSSALVLWLLLRRRAAVAAAA